MSESLDGFDDWFTRLATEPLPGGVAAAALAAAMGAALVVKVSRLSLKQGEKADPDLDPWGVVLREAQVLQRHLRTLAKADEQAYRIVLETKALPVQARTRKQAWQRATDVPIQVAETCQQLLQMVSGLLTVCRPVLRVDLQIGCWLLANGLKAGLLTAEANLQVWGNPAEAQPFRVRMEALQEDGID
jgi:methenyltetrahydrofolate cyclohydrolase